MPLLDLFRFASALLVALVHYALIFKVTLISDAFATSALSWFFIASGFILSWRYHDLKLDAGELKTFFLHRLIRIYPGYLIALALGAAVTVWDFRQWHDTAFAHLGRPYLATYALPSAPDLEFFLRAAASHFAFLQSVAGHEADKFLFNPPLWSISNEMIFYACFPLLLPLARLCHSPLRLAAGFALAAGLQAALVVGLTPAGQAANWYTLSATIYTNPAVRVLEFVLGMLVFQLYEWRRGRFGHGPAGWRYGLLAASLAGYGLMVYLNPGVPYEYALFLVNTPILCALIYATALADWQPRGRLRALAIRAGGISYALYCLHWPAMELAHAAGLRPAAAAWPHVLALFAALIGAAWLLHRYIETPARRALLAWADPQARHRHHAQAG